MGDVVRGCAAVGIVPGASTAVVGSLILAFASLSECSAGDEQPESWGIPRQ